MAATLVVIFTVAVGLASIWLLKFIVRYLRVKKVIDKIPGPPPLPFLGNVLQLQGAGEDFFATLNGFTEVYKKEKLFSLWLGTDPYVALFGADKVDVLLNSTKHMDKPYSYEFLHPWLGTGLLTSGGEKWKVRRRMLTPTFHFKILHDFITVFNEQAAILTRNLEKHAGKGVFNIFPSITVCALDIICETAMGRNINAQSDCDSEYVKAIYSIGEIIQNRQKNPMQWPDVLFSLIPAGKEHARCLSILHRFTDKVIGERRIEFNKSNTEHTTLKDLTDQIVVDQDEVSMTTKKKRLAFLDMLLCEADDGTRLSHSDIREEVDTFMFEGHDTTAAAANWAMHLIGAHQDIQTRVHQELDTIFGNSDRPASMEDLKEMKYLECVIKEALRLFPSVPFFARSFSEDTVIGGYTLPKGVTAVVLTYALHRDEKHFPDPERFDPERFTLENSAGRHPYAYIPFSAGLRNCIGQKFAMLEEKVILSSILRKFSVKSAQRTDDLRPVGELILRPHDGILVELTARR